MLRPCWEEARRRLAELQMLSNRVTESMDDVLISMDDDGDDDVVYVDDVTGDDVAGGNVMDDERGEESDDEGTGIKIV